MTPIFRRAVSPAAVLLLAIASHGAQRPSAFEAIPPSQAARYHVDFAKHFYVTPEAEVAARARLTSALDRLAALKGRLVDSSESLLLGLRLSDDVALELARHEAYLTLRSAVDTRDEQSAMDAGRLEAEVTARTAFVGDDLARVDDAMFARFVAERPELGAYRYVVERARRVASHSSGVACEEAVADVVPLATDWQARLYARLMDRAQGVTIATPSGELNVWRQRNAIANSPDDGVREAGWRARFKALESDRDLFALALVESVTARNHLARLHHFADAPEEVYFASFWTEEEVRATLERVAGEAGLYKRYQMMRAATAAAAAGKPRADIWDLALVGSAAPPRFTVEEASAAIRDALAGLGPEVAAALRDLLDPANGRLDVAPGPHRASGGFSVGFPGTTTAFYSAAFEGYYKDVSVLAHEGTHAAHRQLMGEAGVRPAYAEGPHFLFESFAIFHELLLADSLYARAGSAEIRRYYLTQFLDVKGMTLFSAARDALLEQAVYDGVGRGELKTADDLDALTRRVDARFSIWTDRYSELKGQWMTVRLMYEDPLYLVNYVFASLLALEYYDEYRRDPRSFVPRYVALLRNGFDAPPDALLRRFLRIDPRDPRLVENATRLLAEKISELERLSRSQTASQGEGSAEGSASR